MVDRIIKENTLTVNKQILSTKTIGIFLLGSQKLYELITRIILGNKQFVIVGKSSCVDSPRETIRSLQPDVIIHDIDSTEGNNLRLTQEIKVDSPSICYIIVGNFSGLMSRIRYSSVIELDNIVDSPKAETEIPRALMAYLSKSSKIFQGNYALLSGEAQKTGSIK